MPNKTILIGALLLPGLLWQFLSSLQPSRYFLTIFISANLNNLNYNMKHPLIITNNAKKHTEISLRKLHHISTH